MRDEDDPDVPRIHGKKLLETVARCATGCWQDCCAPPRYGVSPSKSSRSAQSLGSANRFYVSSIKCFYSIEDRMERMNTPESTDTHHSLLFYCWRRLSSIVKWVMYELPTKDLLAASGIWKGSFESPKLLNQTRARA